MINEGTTAYLTVTFRDKNGDLAVPSSIIWSINDKISGTVLQADTDVAIPDSSIEIVISGTINSIIDPLHLQETKVVTVKATYGSGHTINDKYEYSVKNLKYIS